MSLAETAALAAIDHAFGEPVTYVRPAPASQAVLKVIWSDVAADGFQGAGATARTVSCEVRQSDLAGGPSKQDTLVRGGTTWRVIDITRRDDIGKWTLVLEVVASS